MKPNTDQPKVPESKPGSKLDAKDDLKSLPMPEVEKILGSSPDGLSQDEAEKRLSGIILSECLIRPSGKSAEKTVRLKSLDSTAAP